MKLYLWEFKYIFHNFPLLRIRVENFVEVQHYYQNEHLATLDIFEKYLRQVSAIS